MELNDYTTAAIRTESTIDNVNTNLNRLKCVLEILIGAGNMLDDIKKNAFYGREFDNKKFMEQFSMITAAHEDLEVWTKNPNTMLSNLVPVDQNAMIDNGLEVDPRVFHGIIGMATESTELLEALYNSIITGELDVVNTAEECGDSNWYQAILLDALGQDWTDMLVRNIKKLEKRYAKTTFDADEAQQENRDLAAERKILES